MKYPKLILAFLILIIFSNFHPLYSEYYYYYGKDLVVQETKNYYCNNKRINRLIVPCSNEIEERKISRFDKMWFADFSVSAKWDIYHPLNLYEKLRALVDSKETLSSFYYAGENETEAIQSMYEIEDNADVYIGTDEFTLTSNSSQTCRYLIDSSVNEVYFIIMGNMKDSQINLIKPDGALADISDNISSIFSTLIRITNPESGEWQLVITRTPLYGSSNYYLRAACKADIKIIPADENTFVPENTELKLDLIINQSVQYVNVDVKIKKVINGENMVDSGEFRLYKTADSYVYPTELGRGMFLCEYTVTGKNSAGEDFERRAYQVLINKNLRLMVVSKEPSIFSPALPHFKIELYDDEKVFDYKIKFKIDGEVIPDIYIESEFINNGTIFNIDYVQPVPLKQGKHFISINYTNNTSKYLQSINWQIIVDEGEKPLIINEVFIANGAPDWAELYCVQGPVNLSGFMVSKLTDYPKEIVGGELIL